MHPSGLTKDKKYKAMEILIFLSEERHDTIKGCTRVRRSAMWNHIIKKDDSILMVATDLVLMMSVEGVKKERSVAPCGTSSTLY